MLRFYFKVLKSATFSPCLLRVHTGVSFTFCLLGTILPWKWEYKVSCRHGDFMTLWHTHTHTLTPTHIFNSFPHFTWHCLCLSFTNMIRCASLCSPPTLLKLVILLLTFISRDVSFIPRLTQSRRVFLEHTLWCPNHLLCHFVTLCKSLIYHTCQDCRYTHN